MQQTLRKPGFGERLKQLAYLLKHTFTIVGRDPGIVRPWVRMTIYGLVLTCLFFGAITAFIVDANATGMLLLFASIVLFVYRYFYDTRQELRQAWLVSEALQGEKRSADEAKSRVKELAWTARKIALIDLLVAWLMSMARRSNKAGMLVRLFMRGIEEVWDLVNNYLLPSAAVDGYGIRDSVSRMGTLRDNVPETLAGVFGIDIAARAVGSIMAPVYALLFVGSILLGLWVGDAVPAFYAGDAREMFNNVEAGFLPDEMHFSWLPLLIAIWLGKLGSVVLDRLTNSVKVIYFSIFYMRITHAGDIIPEIRDELDSYLRMEAEEPEPVAEPSSA
ncbi:hypothetical protein G4Y73_09305 [Wenzhouxiangella sp. XN201]|uniref:hypothetical protein n=1 Tax=Wenzhouxiangella sp. XN201 TaxID=2710755 RepID=UPI0013C96E70|nr:hypothetical protein [Wenzhouxiangella sp. XN201]NEZ04340.1 hypothetical protein [Wenzhouxiangella sp. XN201]